MSKNQRNQIQENQEQWSIWHKTNTFKSMVRKAIAPILIAWAMLTANEGKAQNSATINPDFYSMANPFVIPNLPSGSRMNIIIKTGKGTRTTVEDIKENGSTQIQNPDGKWLPLTNIIELDMPWVRGRSYTDKEGKGKTISIQVNYQADIFDRTQNSLTQNLRPDIIRGDQATLSWGKEFWQIYQWWYKRKNINDWSYSTPSASDSIKNVSHGTYILRASDGLTRNNDTIAVLQKPTFNKSTRKYDFPSTEKNISYRLYKYDLNGSKNIADSTWTEVEHFVWNGNPYTSTTTLSDKSIYRISAQRTPATDEDTHLPSFKTDFTNATDEIAADDERSFRQTNKELFRDENVEYYVYDLNGKIINSGYNNRASLERAVPGIYIVKSRQDGQWYRNQSKIIVK